MVGVVRANMGDERSVVLDFLIIGRFDGFLPFGQHLVELLDRIVPLLRVEAVEGLIIVAVELRRGLAFELSQLMGVPEEQVIGQLADGVICRGPASTWPDRRSLLVKRC